MDVKIPPNVCYCHGCGLVMRWVYSYKIRVKCYDCGGFALSVDPDVPVVEMTADDPVLLPAPG